MKTEDITGSLTVKDMSKDQNAPRGEISFRGGKITRATFLGEPRECDTWAWFFLTAKRGMAISDKSIDYICRTYPGKNDLIARVCVKRAHHVFIFDGKEKFVPFSKIRYNHTPPKYDWIDLYTLDYIKK